MPTARQIRPPQQERSRHAWDRVLEAGTWILENEGRDALTITGVCERARVTPMAIYRRVDGLAGLFWAIYDRGMKAVVATYEQELARAAAFAPDSPARVAQVVTAVAETFERHAPFLHQIVNYSTTDPALSQRGSDESLVLVERVAHLLQGDDSTAAWDVARMLHQECVFRAMYGDRWLSREPELFGQFVERLRLMAFSRLRVSR
ncbi:MAG: TetR/AcrR family transcriptional regulator [Microbacterium chocolatum]|nr:TetR/AcrR family transcriptional regulator [Microbacterium chocolatum]